MTEVLYDALIRYDPVRGIYAVLTPDGAKAVSDPKRYDRFDIACCNQRIRKEETENGVTIEGYVCLNMLDPLMSMWGLAELMHKHFGINVDVMAADIPAS